MQGLAVPPAHVAPCGGGVAAASSGSRDRSGAAGLGIARRPSSSGLGLGLGLGVVTDGGSASRFGVHCLSLEPARGVRWKKGAKGGGGGGGNNLPSGATAIINTRLIIIERGGCAIERGRRGKFATRGGVEVRADGTEATTTTSETSTRVSGGEAGVTKPAGGEAGPAWLKPGSEELPPWARSEGGEGSSSDEGFEVPFWAWLLASSLVAIAAVGSIFEYFNKNPVFGVVPPDSPFYAPILGFFVLTGFPTAGFLWFKATQAANAIAERMDKEDEISQR
ncbi:hypothetical protein CBR_g16852 [Chara braunii]|uniref:Uncharacterized protein n=1 Tax=Chara braunii TaxID=69332 RepID=A0A388KTZ5_CHABU|nr:hypothetical protein CBR_g16852 [Chara braunii]|eukprot:GBG73509.1 hypothetical protein CBR_g16852 [Chara braunii]